MYQRRLLLLSASEAGLHTTRLKIFAVGNRRDLTVNILAWQPYFEIVGFGRAKPHVAGAQQHDAIGKVKATQNGFCMMTHLFKRLIRMLGVHHLNHFDLVKLMLTDHTARIAPIGTRFTAKTRRMRCHAQRQQRFINNLTAHKVGQRNLCGRNQVVLSVALKLE